MHRLIHEKEWNQTIFEEKMKWENCRPDDMSHEKAEEWKRSKRPNRDFEQEQ